MTEEWKNIAGFEQWKVSNLGRVIGPTGNILKPIQHHKGYVKTAFGRQGRFFTHRIVAIHFIPNPDNKPQVNHKNGIKSDNRVDNLEWSTQSENKKHAFATGLESNKGIRNPSCKLTEIDVIEIRKSADLPRIELSNIYGVSKTAIGDILRGKTWRHLQP